MSNTTNFRLNNTFIMCLICIYVFWNKVITFWCFQIIWRLIYPKLIGTNHVWGVSLERKFCLDNFFFSKKMLKPIAIIIKLKKYGHHFETREVTTKCKLQNVGFIIKAFKSMYILQDKWFWKCWDSDACIMDLSFEHFLNFYNYCTKIMFCDSPLSN